jgi:hypothetical protein
MTMKYSSRSEARRAPTEILRWPTERSRDWVCGFLDWAAADERIVAVVAIGSAVRPNVCSSDLDLIMISTDASVSTGAPPLEIDLRAYSAAQVEPHIGSGHDLLGWAVKYGRVLLQRDHYWDKIANSWQHRLPLPSAALARQRAANAYRRLVEVAESCDTDAVHEQALSYLTHMARAELLDRGVYPASRPELVGQLRAIGGAQIAVWLDRLLRNEVADVSQIDELLKLTV